MKQFRPVLLLAGTALVIAACSHDSDKPRHMHTGGARAGTASFCLLGPFIHSPDGSLRKQDMEAGVQAQFAAADLNHDGVLDGSELSQLNQARKDNCDVTPFIDYSGTGRMGLDEFAARYRTAFEQADEDQDGVATSDEIRKSRRKPGKQRKVEPDDDGDQGAPQGSGAPGGGMPGGMPGGGMPGGAY